MNSTVMQSKISFGGGKVASAKVSLYSGSQQVATCQSVVLRPNPVNLNLSSPPAQKKVVGPRLKALAKKAARDHHQGKTEPYQA